MEKRAVVAPDVTPVVSTATKPPDKATEKESIERLDSDTTKAAAECVRNACGCKKRC
jgi:hypothetical protein